MYQAFDISAYSSRLARDYLPQDALSQRTVEVLEPAMGQYRYGSPYWDADKKSLTFFPLGR